MEGCGEIWRSWLGAARSGIAWLGPVGLGTAVRSRLGAAGNVWSGKAWRGVAVVATCDKARLGWQGWAVMEGRGLIGVRKSRRSW